MFCYSDNVEKELKYNQCIFISLTDSHASHPKEQCCSEETGIQSKRVKLNPEKVEDLAVVKRNLKLLKTMGFIK